MRREYVLQIYQWTLVTGLPLHAQGIREYVMARPAKSGITPACAGNTLKMSGILLLIRDYPCMRREYFILNRFSTDTWGLPLHAQGIQYH